MSISGIRSWLGVIFLLIPRHPISYLFYLLGALVAVKLSFRIVLVLVACSLVFLLSIMFNSMLGYKVSITSALLELSLLFSCLWFVFGGKYIGNKLDAIKFIRSLNIGCFILSIVNMISFGFPFLLPYIHYLPDAYGAMFGLGGARIVTIIGFFGIALEWSVLKNRKNVYLLCAVLNFIVPSYVLGIAVGGLAYILTLLKKPRHIVYVMLLLCIGLFLVNYRVTSGGGVNSMFQEYYGWHPKIIAYINILQVYFSDFFIMLFGTGIGQYASVPAIWASEYYSEIAVESSVPNLPYFFMSDAHDKFLGPYLEIATVNKYAIQSSSLKPYTSISTIFIEFGLPLALTFLFILKRSMNALAKKSNYLMLFFALGLMMVDTWHDNIWFWVLLLAYKRALNEK